MLYFIYTCDRRSLFFSPHDPSVRERVVVARLPRFNAQVRCEAAEANKHIDRTAHDGKLLGVKEVYPSAHASVPMNIMNRPRPRRLVKKPNLEGAKHRSPNQ